MMTKTDHIGYHIGQATVP